MSEYCNKHNTNNCIECAIENQTRQLVAAIRESHATEGPPTFWQRARHQLKLWCSARRPEKKEPLA
jgi:hypothetical protein